MNIMYNKVLQIFRINPSMMAFWRIYGGFPAVIKSRFMWVSFFLTLLIYRHRNSQDWSNLIISAIPSLLGFTIGAMAIVLALPSAKLFRLISEKGAPKSYYMEMAARFVYFVVMQVFSIIFAISLKLFGSIFLGYISAFLFLYSLITAIAVTLALFDLAVISNNAASIKDKQSR